MARWLEWLAVFAATPLVIRLWIPPASWPILLAALAVPAVLVELQGRTWRRRWLGPWRTAERVQLHVLLPRFACCTAALLAALLWLAPERLFDLPRQHTTLWILLLLSYPLFSVYPQEWIYRFLFRRRYRRLFPGRLTWAVASAAAFAWLHVIFGNPWAPLLTLIGGWFFCQTYRASGSLRLVVVEHTLYGAVLFSIGFGQFFHHASLA